METMTSQYEASADVIHAFTAGDCGYLALALNQLTGWSVVTITPVEDENYWPHAAVQMPDGNIIDIEGIWTPDHFEAWWYSDEHDYRIYVRDVEWATASVQKRAPKFPDYDPIVYARKILDGLGLLAA